MALPEDVTTFELTFGPYTDASGEPVLVGTKGKIKPSVSPIRHTASGSVVIDSPIPVEIDEFGVASVELAHTAQAVLSPDAFTYSVTWDVASRKPSPGNKQISVLPTDGTVIDFDLLGESEDVVGVHVPSALSVNGQTGVVVLDAADVGAATPADLATGLATKVNASTYTAGLAAKQDTATLAADTATHVSDGSALDVALRAASGAVALGVVNNRRRKAGQGLVVISMDDADSTMYDVALAMQQRGQRGTFFITTGSAYLNNGPFKLSSAQMQQMDAWGHEIGTHSINHDNMAGLTPAQVADNLDTPKAAVEAIIGAGKATSFAYPFGTGAAGRTNATDSQVHCRYQQIHDTTNNGQNGIVSLLDPYMPTLIPRMSWNEQNQQQALDHVRAAATRPVAANIYFHRLNTSLNPTTAQLTELLDLCLTLGVPVVSAREAYGSMNLLTDPGFEAPPAMFAGGSGWKIFKNGTNTATVVADAPMDGYSGTQSLRLAVSDTGFAYVRQQVHVIPGLTYVFSGRHRCPVVPGSANRSYMRIRGLDYGQSMIAQTNSADAQSATWAKVSMTYAVPQNVKMLDLDLVLTGAPGEVLWDHMWFQPQYNGDLG